MASPTPVISTAAIIQDAVEGLIERFGPIKIILFGSHARGDATVDSDVDFLVVMPNGTDRRQTAIEIHRHLRDLPLPKDILVTTPEEIARRGSAIGGALRTALREGKVLYERR